MDMEVEEDMIVASAVAYLMEENIKSSSSSSTSSSEEDLVERRVDLKLGSDFVEQSMKYDDQEFSFHYRLTKRTVLYIILLIKENNVFPNYKSGRENITPEKGVYMTIWYLVNRETFRQVANRFNVTLSASHRCIKLVIKYLVENRKKFVMWPRDAEMKDICRGFPTTNNFPNCVGAIDGTHIPILKPKNNQEAYCNRKGYHSIILQAVCDNKKKCIDFYCGEPGSRHDARVLKKSNLYRDATSGKLKLNNCYLFGDSAYPNLKWLVTPYKDNGCLTEAQKYFNYKHSSTRIVIENAFGLLKSRFRRLKGFENLNIGFIVGATIAACVLHNICVIMDDSDSAIQKVEEDIESPSDSPANTKTQQEYKNCTALLHLKCSDGGTVTVSKRTVYVPRNCIETVQLKLRSKYSHYTAVVQELCHFIMNAVCT